MAFFFIEDVICLLFEWMTERNTCSDAGNWRKSTYFGRNGDFYHIASKDYHFAIYTTLISSKMRKMKQILRYYLTKSCCVFNVYNSNDDISQRMKTLFNSIQNSLLNGIASYEPPIDGVTID